MAALPLPDLECFYSIEPQMEHEPLEPTKEQLDALIADYHAPHLDLDTDTSVSSESQISTTDSQPHYTQINQIGPKASKQCRMKMTRPKRGNSPNRNCVKTSHQTNVEPKGLCLVLGKSLT